MKLDVERRDGACLVRVGEARIDAAIATTFKEAVRKAAGEDDARVVLDLSAVGFLDSSGLGALVSVMKLLGPGRRLDLAGVQPNVRRVFDLTRMDRVFAIHATPGEALAAAGVARGTG